MQTVLIILASQTMNQYLKFLLVAIFSIFIGAQITEGALFVPYWESLSPNEFHVYYKEFGPSIGKFYTVLTIIAAIIPIVLAFYCKLVRSKAFAYAVASSFFSILFVACFYVYFKGANEQFSQVVFSEIDLKKELQLWINWHWGRVLIEVISLLFLILALINIDKNVLQIN